MDPGRQCDCLYGCSCEFERAENCPIQKPVMGRAILAYNGRLSYRGVSKDRANWAWSKNRSKNRYNGTVEEDLLELFASSRCVANPGHSGSTLY